MYGPGKELFLFQFDADSRGFGKGNVASLDYKREVHDLVADLLKVDEVFGDEKVGDGGADLQGSGQTDGGAIVVVGGDGHHIGLGHGGDFFELEDAAAIADVGVEDVGGLFFKDRGEFGLGVELFAGDDGEVDLAADFGQGVEIAGGDRFFVPEGSEFYQTLRYSYRVHGGQAAMDFDEDFNVGADGLADLGDPLNGLVFFTAADMGAPGGRGRGRTSTR